MERTRNIDEFVANPVGRYIVGPTHLVWCHSSTLCGSASWGRPTEQDVHELVAAWQFSIHPALGSGFSAIMDDHALEHVDLRTTSIVLEGIRHIAPRWHRLVRRQAVIIPPGMV